jgi:DNA invertase Pin-like site-specific DNA recombinase
MNTTTNTTTSPRKRRRRRHDRTGLPMAGYVRVSTSGQAASGLGLDAQRDALTRWAGAEGVALEVHEDAGRSRAAGNLEHRGEGIAAALMDVRSGNVAGLVVAKVDRLGSGSDVVRLAEEAKRDGWRLVILDLCLDTATTAGMLVLTVMAGCAAHEHQRIGERNREWKQQARVRGTHRGAHAHDRAIADRIIAAREAGRSYRAIAADLDADGVPTARGGKWQAASVRSVERTRRLEIEAQAAA